MSSEPMPIEFEKTAENLPFTKYDECFSSEAMPKEFEKTTEVLPFTKYGLSSMQEFKDTENEISQLECLKTAGLSYDEIKLYQDNEAGLLELQKKVEANAMQDQLDVIYTKVRKMESESNSSEKKDEQPSTSSQSMDKVHNSLTFYPEGHPMNNIKEIEVDLFGHLQADDVLPISKRRKMLRRFERKKERVMAHERQVNIATCGLAMPGTSKEQRPHSLWDVRETASQPDYVIDLERNQNPVNANNPRNRNDHHPGEINFNENPSGGNNGYQQNRRNLIGPRNQQLYTIRDDNIVRLERVNQDVEDEYNAVEIVVPENPAEEQLLEGTKMSIDNIRRIARFRDYDPGVPSKILYLKNISPNVTQEQVSLLFNQFVLANGGPIDVRLMTSGRMRGQAFAEFQKEDICMQALEETNGTILSGQPVIALFARNTNHRRPDDNR